MKTGLVLEGGGIRGIFSSGVLDVLMEEGIEFDGAVGVSAGAAFGCNYKSRQPRRAIRYNLRYAKDPRYASVRSLIRTGDMFNAHFCYHEIPEKLDPFDWKTFRENPMAFYLVCTDVETGKPVYHKCDEDGDWEMLEWFRASGSMPLVSRIVEIGGYKLLDGGVTDSIPLRFMEEQGYERNLVILTRPLGYLKKANPLMPLIRRSLREYPAAVEAIENRHIGYNETLAYIRRREADGSAFVIRPKEEIDAGRVEHDRDKIRAAYKEGRRTARRLLPQIRRFLAGEAAAAVVPAAPVPAAAGSVVHATAPAAVHAAADPAAMSTAGPAAGDPAAAPAVASAAASGGVSATAFAVASSGVSAAAASPVPASEENGKTVTSGFSGRPVHGTAGTSVRELTQMPAPAETAGKAAPVPAPLSIPRRRRHQKIWKPGSMEALKQQCGGNTQ